MNKLYFLLKRFEVHRSTVVFDLLEKGSKMLDVACGNGDLAITALAKFNNIYGIDISKSLILKAKELLKRNKIENVTLEICDVNRGLPFKNEYFDTVTSIAALAFFLDPYFVMSEFNRVLKNKGILIIEVPNLAYLPRRFTLLFGKLPKVASTNSGWDGGHLHNFTKEEMERLLTDSGFKIVKVTGSGIFANLRNWWPSLLCGNIIIKAVKK